MPTEIALESNFTRLELDDGVATLRLDRAPVNALSLAMQAEIRAAAHWLATAGEVRAVVIHGGPKVFAAGADIKEMAAMSYRDMAIASRGLQESFQAVAAIPCPVIAAITGYALGGGCELALCADLRIAGDNVKLGQPELLLGLIPGLGGTQRLARLVGPSRAKDLIFTGRHVSAAEALAMGLVDRVVAPDDVLAAATKLARTFANGAPLALAAAKRAIDHGAEVDVVTGCEIERLEFAGLFATDDARIGMHSFMASGPGKAHFTGR